ncbi:MAG: lipase family protein [Spirochaetaceae bacterium]|nr:lipase family protein [Spirochaetaceae bacterium]
MIPERFKFSKKLTPNELFPNMDYPYFERVRHTGFFHRKNEFSLVNACFLAEASLLSYNQPSFIKYAFYYAGFDDFKMFIGKNVARCFTAKKGNCLIVVFRGTELKLPFSIPGFIADFKIAMSPEKNGGFVHSGFQAVLDEIWEGEGMLHEYLLKQKEKKPFLRIFATGHSLGAALSLILAARFPHVNCVYTFGCPRVGSQEFADTIKAKVFRIVHNNDIITEVPFQKFRILKIKNEYLHIGELEFIDSKGKLRNKSAHNLAILKELKEKNILKGPALFEEFIATLVKTRTSYFSDHSPYFYATKLWNAYLDLSASSESGFISRFISNRKSKF